MASPKSDSLDRLGRLKQGFVSWRFKRLTLVCLPETLFTVNHAYPSSVFSAADLPACVNSYGVRIERVGRIADPAVALLVRLIECFIIFLPQCLDRPKLIR